MLDSSRAEVLPSTSQMPAAPEPTLARGAIMNQHSLRDFRMSSADTARKQYIGPAGADVAAGIAHFEQAWATGCMPVPSLNITEIAPESALAEGSSNAPEPGSNDSPTAASDNEHATVNDADEETTDSESDDDGPDEYFGYLIAGKSKIEARYDDICNDYVVCFQLPSALAGAHHTCVQHITALLRFGMIHVKKI